MHELTQNLRVFLCELRTRQALQPQPFGFHGVLHFLLLKTNTLSSSSSSRPGAIASWHLEGSHGWHENSASGVVLRPRTVLNAALLCLLLSCRAVGIQSHTQSMQTHDTTEVSSDCTAVYF